MSPVVWLSNAGLGAVLNAGFRVGYTPQTMRRNFRWICKVPPTWLQRRFPNLASETRTIDSVECEAIFPKGGYNQTLIYLHGGGYFMGSSAEYRPFAARIASSTGVRVLLVNYRLAPEHPHPAPLEDAIKVYKKLIDQVFDHKFILGGDSAGGGLALSLLLALRDQKVPLPRKAFCVSPWTDRSGSCASIDANETKDVWLSRRHIDAWAPWSLAGQNARDPYISPLFGKYDGIPPSLIFVGDQEVLFDEARLVVDKAKSENVDAELIVGRFMQHDWFISLPFLTESRSAYRKLVEFIRE
ncbi:MAG: alpha/beta hydrolase [Bdellovibrio sp.]|nr:MAG: alpha/beta hydrolase [Bdellovibrio sp.]